MRHICLAFLVWRTDTRVLNGKRGGKNHTFPQGLLLPGLKNDTGNARIKRQPGHKTSVFAQAALGARAKSSQFIQQTVTVAQRTGWRRIDEGKGRWVAKL